MLLDEELTESMREHTYRQTNQVGDSVVDFEDQGLGLGLRLADATDEACAEYPMIDGSVMNNNPLAGAVGAGAVGGASDDLYSLDQPMDVSTENIGLLVFSSLQSMAPATGGRERSNGVMSNTTGASRLGRRHVNVRVNHAMQMKQCLGRDGLQRADLSATKFQRSGALEPCAFLEPGVTFRGTQDVSPSISKARESWDLRITVEERNFSKGYICGTMHANGFNCSSTDERSPVVTFWEGELIDNINNHFYTQKWGATKAIDRNHWLKLQPFCRAIADRGTKPDQEAMDLATQPFIYMRLKEKYFLNEAPGGNLTIAGFYYLCISRATGEISGYYFDPNSTPYQKVKLQVMYEGSGGFSSAGGDLI